MGVKSPTCRIANGTALFPEAPIMLTLAHLSVSFDIENGAVRASVVPSSTVGFLGRIAYTGSSTTYAAIVRSASYSEASTPRRIRRRCTVIARRPRHFLSFHREWHILRAARKYSGRTAGADCVLYGISTGQSGPHSHRGPAGGVASFMPATGTPHGNCGFGPFTQPGQKYLRGGFKSREAAADAAFKGVQVRHPAHYISTTLSWSDGGGLADLDGIELLATHGLSLRMSRISNLARLCIGLVG
ncbi:hypothetical protein GGX14DRAFT_544901 [Mycena pura]|uniref:Uncharacterized protein n=1 Tax=Mycena pura TaxID=153505 RepID=A0AAD6YB74_9AGAR|nr:hypothetical protein GGX14DRAFT_544901 [Mycena pura]